VSGVEAGKAHRVKSYRKEAASGRHTQRKCTVSAVGCRKIRINEEERALWLKKKKKNDEMMISEMMMTNG